MKTFKLIFYFLFFIVLTVHGYADGDRSNKTDNTYTELFYNEIRSQLFYPQTAKDNGIEGFVIVSFTISNEGKIQILELNSNDPLFYQAAVNSLSEITLCTHAAGKIYNMKFSYNLL